MIKTYIFDLDGTLANLDHRLDLLELDEPLWDVFFELCSKDKPIQWTIDLLKMIRRANPESYILILSGRSDMVIDKTIEWLSNHDIVFDRLIMRKNGDRRPDQIIKKEMLDKFLKDNPENEIQFIVDDRQKVVDMWRENGFNVLQCNKWEEK